MTNEDKLNLAGGLAALTVFVRDHPAESFRRFEYFAVIH